MPSEEKSVGGGSSVEYDTSNDSEYGARGNAYRKQKEVEWASLYAESQAGVEKVKEIAQREEARKAYYNTNGEWVDTPEGVKLGEHMTEMQGSQPVIDRAVHNSPPPLDDVGGTNLLDFDEFDPDLEPTWEDSALFTPLVAQELTEHDKRKATPLCRGLLDYFPLACAAVARVSQVGNDQHNPGEPMHWAKGKSTDHADCIVRHLVERGTLDRDGQRHTAKVAWRALALLQTELEKDQ